MNKFTFHLRSNKKRNTQTVSVDLCFLLLRVSTNMPHHLQHKKLLITASDVVSIDN